MKKHCCDSARGCEASDCDAEECDCECGCLRCGRADTADGFDVEGRLAANRYAVLRAASESLG